MHKRISFAVIFLLILLGLAVFPVTVRSAAADKTANGSEAVGKEKQEESVSEREKREPFYCLYKDAELDTIVFEGTVKASSLIPDPEKNDYPNCLYALFVEIDSILSRSSPDKGIASEAIVIVPVIKDKAILPGMRFLPGDKIRCACAEYDSMPQDIQEIQLSDDIQSPEHQQYYALNIRKIDKFDVSGNRNFAKREITILPVQTLPKDENAAGLRKARIQSEIAKIEAELKKHGGSFDAWREEYKPIAEKYRKLCDEEYKGWINDSFFAAGGSETMYNPKLYIEGIRPYKEFLESNNIDLIILRVPSKWDFAARVLAADDFQENPDWIEHCYECLKNDIEIVDPMPEMWKHRFDFPLFYFYHIPSESHPCEGEAFISAQVLAEILKRYDYSAADKPITLEISNFKTDQARFFWPEGNGKFDPKENIVFKQTNQNGQPVGNLAVNTGSPFLFLSNSYFAYPQRSLGASLPGYTAFFLQHIPDWFYQDGTKNAMIRTLITNREALSNRKAVIMVGHPVFWADTGIPKLPKYIQDNASSMTLEKTLDLLDDDLLSEGKECYVFTKRNDGCISFRRDNSVQPTPHATGKFQAKISVPPLEGKNTCMIRLNFESNAYLTIAALSEDNLPLDSVTLAPGKNMCADLFIPISGKQMDITLRFASRSRSKYVLRNIELWYY